MCIPRRDHTLAQREGLGSVTLCGCGTLHLAVGGVTLHLAPEAFHALLTLCQDAAQQLLMEAGFATAGLPSKTTLQ